MFSSRYTLPRCEFYQRFATVARMTESKHWNTYHRSIFKRIEGVKPSQFTFHPTKPDEKITKACKTGTYYSPFYFAGYQSAVVPKAEEGKTYPSQSYDAFLDYQRKIARYIVDEVAKKQPRLLVNADYDYPCVLIQFPKPKEAKENDWVHFVILHYVAIANDLSERSGLNCELVRRSGFGHLRPSVSETAPSLRISVGFIPKEYADVLIQALLITYQLLCGKERVVYDKPFAIPELTTVLQSYNEARGLQDKKMVALQATLWKTFWSRFDSKGGSFLAQILRKELCAEWIINQLMDGFRRCVDIPYSSIKSLESLVITPWVEMLKHFTNAQDSRVLSLTPPKEKLPTYSWHSKPVAIHDESFLQILQRLHIVFDIEKCDQTIHLEGLHERLEAASAEMFFKPIEMEHEEGYGSDSECEEMVPLAKKKETLYAKKFITATGMRAIQLVFAAVKRHWHEDYGLDFRNLRPELEGMYYETKEALTTHAIPIPVHSIETLAANQYVLPFYDLNHCNVTHAKPKLLEERSFSRSQICVLDTTSATTNKTAKACRFIFNKNPDITSIILVSSGLKSEQAGSDLNPYGTIRIISRTAKERDALYADLVALEEKANYKHPAKSHLLRKNAKLRELTPRNMGLFKAMKQEESSEPKLDTPKLCG
ncbi:hypothetical protein [Legionella impletisoli]|uniref:Coiled-coil-containing protein n=1 Tax=Legionella impletisoli TaxID=343510 RepID=A0A917JYB8_9GAMM|nr:hypothetical protein [Legionella impletisoli]GGI92591.1 hypothetical protein GCM10007966_21530 [Legionella impletisoli]